MTSEVVADLPLLDAALAYRDAGLSVIATRRDKRPVMAWKEYQTAIANDDQLADMFLADAAESVGVVCGRVSGCLECLDFDARGEAFAPWMDLVEADDPSLPDRLVVAATPSGGRHVIYRCPDAVIPGSQKLAMRGRDTVLVETRGEGGYFCAAPSPGYAIIQGDLARVQAVTPERRDILIRSARFLNEAEQPLEAPSPVRTALPGNAGHYRPGDDFNQRCGRDALADLLSRHGWRFWRQNGPNSAWTRPGKERGVSATVRNVDGVEVFYVFTSSSPFEPMRGYSPFQVYAILEHGGDYAEAAAALNRLGFGVAPDDGFDVGGFVAQAVEETESMNPVDTTGRIPDPGPFPEHLLRVPGFMGELARYIDERNFKSQPVVALGAALVAMGTLAGRKVEGVTGLRTNFYVLGVIESGEGKNAPREVLMQLLHDPENLFYYAVDRLKSDAGIRSALEVNPCTVFLLDEIGEFLEMIKNAKNSFWIRNIIPELMTLYSSASSPHVRMGGFADIKKTLDINCPHVCLFGTSVSRSIFQSMTMNSVTSGFIGRLTIFEGATENPPKKRGSRAPIPDSLLNTAKWWQSFTPNGILTGTHAGSISAPILVDESAEATAVFDRCEVAAREDISKYGREWSGPYNRTEENARKLAIAYACSECKERPFIGKSAAEWGATISLHLTRRLVYLASINVADNETHDKKNRVLRIILDAGRQGIRHSSLIDKCRFLKGSEFNDVLNSLIMAENIRFEEKKTKTKPFRIYYANNLESS